MCQCVSVVRLILSRTMTTCVRCRTPVLWGQLRHTCRKACLTSMVIASGQDVVDNYDWEANVWIIVLVNIMSVDAMDCEVARPSVANMIMFHWDPQVLLGHIPSAKRKDHLGVSSGWSSVWHRSNTGLSSTQYEQIPIIFRVWPFWLTPFFFRSVTFWRATG